MIMPMLCVHAEHDPIVSAHDVKAVVNHHGGAGAVDFFEVASSAKAKEEGLRRHLEGAIVGGALERVAGWLNEKL